MLPTATCKCALAPLEHWDFAQCFKFSGVGFWVQDDEVLLKTSKQAVDFDS